MYLTTITFLTAEPVTADHLACRILQQAGGGALRPGEGCILPSDPSKRLIVGDESLLEQIRRELDDPTFLADA